MSIKVQKLLALVLVLGMVLTLCACEDKRERRRRKENKETTEATIAEETTLPEETDVPEETTVPEEPDDPTEPEPTWDNSLSESLGGEWIYADGELVLCFEGGDSFTLIDYSDLENVDVTEGSYFCDGSEIYFELDDGNWLIAKMQEDRTMVFYDRYDGYFFQTHTESPVPTIPVEDMPELDGEWVHETQKITIYFAQGNYFEYTEMDNLETAFMIDGGCRYEDGTIIMETDTDVRLTAHIGEDGYLYLDGQEGRFYRSKKDNTPFLP